MKQFKPICVFLLMLAVSIPVFAQNRITGNVSDPSGEPIIGASILEKGTSNGAITDIDGNFSLNVSSIQAVIEISFIGYKKVEVRANDKNIKKIVLNEDSELLEEVVVVGYGTQRKATLTGAVAVVDDKIFKDKGGLSTPLQALQGQVPGLMITRSSTAPGDESWNMEIRGPSSINNAEPLVIIDGVALGSLGDLKTISSNEIESISFLKDGAAAIYGNRAAGGVMLVTTKKGVQGKTKVSYNATATIKTVGLMPSAMNIDQWADGVMTALSNDNQTNNSWYTYAQLAKKYKGSYIDLEKSANPFGTGAFTDVSDFVFNDKINWLDSLFGESWSTDHNLSVSGGSERSSFLVSLNYMYDGSTLQYGKNNNQRYNLRATNTYKLSEKFTLESSLSYTRQEQIAPTNIGSVLTTQIPMPGLPFRTIDGRPYAWGTWGSPVAKIEQGGDNKLSVSTLNINESLKYKITPWLNLTTEAGYKTSSAYRDEVGNAITYYNYTGTKQVREDPIQANTFYRQTSARTDFYSFTGYFNAHHKFADKHDFNTTLGMQYEFNDYTYFGVKIEDIQEGLQIINGSGEITLPDRNRYQSAILSYFGRFNYAYADKYLFEINGRYDGSSKFLPENRWDLFYGTSIGWRIKQENFMRNVQWLHDLKLRLSYSEMGNQGGIGNYDGIQLYTLESGKGVYVGGDKLSYIKTSGTLASTTRQWERIMNYNAGLDFGVLDGKLTGSLDAFMKRNNNMLVNVNFPATLGDDAPDSNVGKFRTWGFEGQLNYRGHIGELKYHAGGVLSFARNKLIDKGGLTVINSGFHREMQAFPLRSVFGLRYGGKIQNEEQLAAYKAKYLSNSGIGIPSELRVGDNMYVDENKDGKLDHEDYIFLGSDRPEISFSFNLGAEYKGFDLNIIFQGTANRFIYRGMDNWTVPFRANYTNTLTSSIGNTWSEDNRDAYYAPYTNNANINNYNYQASSLTAQDGRYIRLKNITIGYSFPQALLKKTRCLQGARLYITGADLWESTRIKDGWDPEAAAYENDGKPIGGGIKRYPFTRNFIFGVNLTF